jgi:hypothetical protein
MKPAYQEEVEALFSEAGLTPIYKEMRADGMVSYWFGKEQLGELTASGVLERIPLEYWAVRAFLGRRPG